MFRSIWANVSVSHLIVSASIWALIVGSRFFTSWEAKSGFRAFARYPLLLLTAGALLIPGRIWQFYGAADPILLSISLVVIGKVRILDKIEFDSIGFMLLAPGLLAFGGWMFGGCMFLLGMSPGQGLEFPFFFGGLWGLVVVGLMTGIGAIFTHAAALYLVIRLNRVRRQSAAPEPCRS